MATPAWMSNPPALRAVSGLLARPGEAGRGVAAASEDRSMRAAPEVGSATDRPSPEPSFVLCPVRYPVPGLVLRRHVALRPRRRSLLSQYDRPNAGPVQPARWSTGAMHQRPSARRTRSRSPVRTMFVLAHSAALGVRSFRMNNKFNRLRSNDRWHASCFSPEPEAGPNLGARGRQA